MLLTNIKQRTIAKDVTEAYKFDILNRQPQLVGIRAHTVTLDYHELLFLLNNKDYAMHVVHCLYLPPTSEFRIPKKLPEF